MHLAVLWPSSQSSSAKETPAQRIPTPHPVPIPLVSWEAARPGDKGSAQAVTCHTTPTPSWGCAFPASLPSCPESEPSKLEFASLRERGCSLPSHPRCLEMEKLFPKGKSHLAGAGSE